MAEQLSIESPMFSYYTIIPTIKQLELMMQQLYSYRQFHDQVVLVYLEQWIYEVEGVWYSTEQANLLANRFLNKCINEKIIPPGLAMFERLYHTL